MAELDFSDIVGKAQSQDPLDFSDITGQATSSTKRGTSNRAEDMPSQGAIDPYSGQFISGISQSDVNRMLSESGKGVISGVFQTATGLGELLPGEAGRKSARATQALREYGYGPSQVLGGMLVPGVGASKAPILAGALAGAATPTGEEDTTTRYGEKALGALLGTVPGILGKAIGYGSELFSKARGKDVSAAAEELRRTVKGLTEQEIVTQTEVAKKAQADLNRISAAQRQIAERDAVAAERAARQAGTPPEAMADIRSKTLAKTRERVADAQKAAREAGLNEAETAAHVADVESRVVGAEDAIQQLEQRLASGEQIAPEQFGSIIRDTAEKIRDEGVANREKLAGFGQAISSAGQKLIVDTTKVVKKINSILKNERDPSIINTLNILKNQLTTTVRNKEVNALNIASTDSLRKAMDRILATKTVQMANGMAGDAAAAVHHVADIKDLLVNTAKKAHDPYRNALEKYAELSRPLDIVSRKGPLRAVLDIDSLSQDFLRGSAEVAGRVIQRAREGHPVFTRLMAENPEIQNGARAYFNRELFGGGRVPTVDSLRSFVQKNEGVLKQLGLYDEFSTVASARASGQRALDAVKAELTQAKAAQKAATTSARQAERAITEQERLRGVAAGRVAEAEKAAVAPEKIATEAEKRVAKAESKLSKKAEAPTAAKSAAETRADALKQSTEELDSVDLKGVTKKSTSILKDLRSRNVISSDEYTKMLDQINMIDKAYGESEKARTMAKRILYGGLAAVGTEQLIQRYVFGGK